MILEISIPDGARILRRRQPKTVAQIPGDQRGNPKPPRIVLVKLPDRFFAQYQPALWCRTFKVRTVKEYSDTLPKDGKGFSIHNTGKLKQTT